MITKSKLKGKNLFFILRNFDCISQLVIVCKYKTFFQRKIILEVFFSKKIGNTNENGCNTD